MKSTDFSYYAVVRQWVQWSGGESDVGAAGGRDTIKGEQCERPAWVEASNEDRIVWNEQQKLKQH